MVPQRFAYRLVAHCSMHLSLLLTLRGHVQINRACGRPRNQDSRQSHSRRLGKLISAVHNVGTKAVGGFINCHLQTPLPSEGAERSELQPLLRVLFRSSGQKMILSPCGLTGVLGIRGVFPRASYQRSVLKYPGADMRRRMGAQPTVLPTTPV